MLTFAVVAGPAIPERIRAALGNAAPADLPFEAARHVVWSNPEGTVLFAGWQDGGDVGMGTGWWIDDAGLTAFTGHVWPRSGVWSAGPSWAEQLGAYLRRRPLQGGTDDLLGIFTAISLDSDGSGTVATDALGTSMVYRARTGGAEIVSSRAALAARLAVAGAPPRDGFGVGWLAYCGYQIGERTGYEDVEVVPFGVHVDVTLEGRVRVRQTAPPWRTLLDGDPVDAVDEVYSDIATSSRAVLSYTVDDRVVELTGGKDSRLILAVLLAEALADQFEYRTLGGPDLPDVVIAQRIASAFGLRHQRGVDAETMRRSARRRERLAEALPDVSVREREFRLNVGEWAGMRNGWQLHAASPTRRDRVALCGVYGETLATNHTFANRLVSHATLRQSLLVDMKFGAAGILKPDALERYRADVMANAYQGMSLEDAPQDVFDAFYLRNRIRRWYGTTQEYNEQHRVLPLHSAMGVRLAFTLGPRDRHAHAIHRQLYRRAFPVLLDHPFKDDAWMQDRAWHERRPEPDTTPALRPITAPQQASSRSVAALEWRRPTEADDVDMMRRYLLGDPSNPVFELLDRRAVQSAIDGFDALPENGKHQLYGALTAALWLGHHEVTLSEG